MGAFNKEFMKQFDKEHKAAFGPNSEAAEGGWPDAGDGRYSDKLAYKDWVEFNNVMRAHQNFVEMLPMQLAFLLVGGLIVPKFTMYVGFVAAIARIAYSI